ncbi:hypothetical protein SAY87_003296 [Trapa incisa]|uniref:Uncharacterized protein n=1 Tax=Trapa incisa TaxID=236973 RepID=A0AAN7QL32_9MYRT|nr:hypothetical protein SAY87_003296 [Trapa incisa]
MNRRFIRTISLVSRRFLVESSYSSQRLASVAAPASNRPTLRPYSIKSDSLYDTNSKPPESQVRDVVDDDNEVTEEELKRRIQKFYDGDDEAIPSILEGILRRKLAGKNDEHLIDELPCKTRRGNEDSSSDDEDID